MQPASVLSVVRTFVNTTRRPGVGARPGLWPRRGSPGGLECGGTRASFKAVGGGGGGGGWTGPSPTQTSPGRGEACLARWAGHERAAARMLRSASPWPRLQSRQHRMKHPPRAPPAPTGRPICCDRDWAARWAWSSPEGAAKVLGITTGASACCCSENLAAPRVGGAALTCAHQHGRQHGPSNAPAVPCTGRMSSDLPDPCWQDWPA